MIRQASHADLDALTDVGMRFAAWAYPDIEPDRASVEAFLAGILGEGIIWIAKGSMLGAVVRPHPINANLRVATELVWYSETGAGGRLLLHFEAWAEAHADIIAVSNIEAMSSSAERIYRRLDYRPTERIWTRSTTDGSV